MLEVSIQSNTSRQRPARPALSTIQLGWLLALLPFALFGGFVVQAPPILNGSPVAWSIPWLPTLAIKFGFYLDGLSALFALLITGIGTGTLIYAGYYFHSDQPTHDATFFAYLITFMLSMLGLVLAADVITLFVFWEGTSITSFLLVAYKNQYEDARRGAFKALFITGGGGIALLAGLLIAAYVVGSSDLAILLANGDLLRASPLYPVIVLLIALGAFTKSAQFPAHFWLPSAMSAPTPASAYLHSATMVKAGLYLMARLYPALGGTALWFWLLTSVGGITMVTGAIVGLRQHDLKGLLAYSTIAQLGILMLLLGQNEGTAFKAFAVGLMAHAFYKASLFMVAGIVDHATGTRDLRQLGPLQLAKHMPRTLGIAVVAGLSMAGLPPLLGFLAKETLLAALLESHLPELVAGILIAAVVGTGAFFLVQAGIFVIDTFFGQLRIPQKPPTDQQEHPPQDPPWGMLFAPLIMLVLSVVFALEQVLPVLPIDLLVGAAATAISGERVKANLDLFHGVNLPLLLSVTAMVLGVALFILRHRWMDRSKVASSSIFSIETLYRAVLDGLDGIAAIATRLQSGSLRRYLVTILLFALSLGLIFGNLPLGNFSNIHMGEFSLVRMASLLLSAGAAAASVLLKRDLQAILALSASGIGVALLIALEPSPDVALVQIVVDILTTLLLVFALVKLKPSQNAASDKNLYTPKQRSRILNAGIAAAAGALVAGLCFFTLTSRPRESLVTPFYEQNSKSLTGAADIVGAIVVDFRGFDTMIEVSVFSMAGLAVMSLLRFARKKHADSDENDIGVDNATDNNQPQGKPSQADGMQIALSTNIPSPLLRMLAEITLPLALLIGFIQMTWGHDQPGDGFTAGIIISLAVGFLYLVLGPHEAKRRLPWLKPAYCIGSGILLVVLGSFVPVLAGGVFFAPLDIGHVLHLPLPDGFDISTSWLFEIAICLAVIGSASFMVNTFVEEG